MFETCMKVKTIMDKYGYPWFIEGGWAIDLFLNRETREHKDIEIGIYRKNQMQLYRYFGKQRKYYIDNTSHIGKQERREWNKEYLRLPIYEVYVEYEGIEIEVVLNEKDEENLIYRLNEKTKINEEKAILYSNNDIPYLSPEIVLLYKSKYMRDKDIADISNASKLMDGSQKKWLIDNIEDKNKKERIRNLTQIST